MSDGEVMTNYCIYFNPSDHPNKYVVRRWFIHSGGRLTAEADPEHICDGLEEARIFVPPGYINVGRQLHDDPVIVETWI